MFKLDPEAMTKSETEALGEVSDIVMTEGSNLNTPHASRDENLLYHMLKFVKIPKMWYFSGISGVDARKLDYAFMTSQTVARGDNNGVTWETIRHKAN